MKIRGSFWKRYKLSTHQSREITVYSNFCSTLKKKDTRKIYISQIPNQHHEISKGSSLPSHFPKKSATIVALPKTSDTFGPCDLVGLGWRFPNGETRSSSQGGFWWVKKKKRQGFFSIKSWPFPTSPTYKPPMSDFYGNGIFTDPWIVLIHLFRITDK